MKTNIRFGMDKREMKKMVEVSLCSLNVHDEDAIDSVFTSFWNADSSSGNGMSDTGSFTKGVYHSTANISTGEYVLYIDIRETE